MNKQLRHFAIGILTLGLTSPFGLPAVAQDIEDDNVVVEERYTVVEPDESVAETADDVDTVVIAARDGNSHLWRRSIARPRK